VYLSKVGAGLVLTLVGALEEVVVVVLVVEVAELELAAELEVFHEVWDKPEAAFGCSSALVALASGADFHKEKVGHHFAVVAVFVVVAVVVVIVVVVDVAVAAVVVAAAAVVVAVVAVVVVVVVVVVWHTYSHGDV
jgi:hypothetical protein